MRSTILMIGTFDSKGSEYAFLRERLLAEGSDVIAVNAGVLGTTDEFEVDIEAEEVARSGDGDLAQLRAEGDRNHAMQVMGCGAAAVTQRLYQAGRLDGVIGMGGSGGSSVVTAAMRALPVGVPKLCVSTLAATDTSEFVGAKDITLMPAVTDVAGVNRISRLILSRAAGAVCGMARVIPPQVTDERKIVAATMFGNTTTCVDACRQLLTDAGYEVLVFHATGTGGRTMESLIDEGLVDACLDITTTEWADTVCGGVFSAGEDRLAAPGRRGIPHLIVPGCVDMANFTGLESVPAAYREANRLFYEWNPSVTLMRTNAAENRKMGQIFAAKANAAEGPVAFLLPLRGVSILDGDGERFCDREADEAFFAALKQELRAGIPVVEVDANINDPVFSKRAADMMLDLIRTGAVAD